MSPRTPPAQTTATAAQLRSLANPARVQVFRAFEQLGTCSVAEIADLLQRKKESTYYHVHQLVKAGLVIKAGSRGTARRDETLYRLKFDRVTFDPERRTAAYLDAQADIVSAALRHAERQHGRAVEDPEVEVSGSSRQRYFKQYSARLDKETLRELNRRLDRVMELLDTSEPPEGGGEVYTVTMLLHPAF